jgi:flagellar biosynthesis protein FlhA
MLEGMRQTDAGTQIMMDQNTIESVLNSVKDSLSTAEATGQDVVLVCAPALRAAVRRLVSAQSGGLPVLSYQEVTSSNAQIETVGVVRVAAIAAA